MLLASFLPCADAKGFGALEKTTITTYITVCNDSQYQDMCPPFCKCQCCSVITIYHSIQTVLSQVIPYHQLYIFPPANAVIQRQQDIWQPPQL